MKKEKENGDKGERKKEDKWLRKYTEKKQWKKIGTERLRGEEKSDKEICHF